MRTEDEGKPEARVSGGRGVVGLEARLLALETLRAWSRSEGFVAETHRRLSAKWPDMDEGDRALALEIAFGTLRHVRLLQYNLDKFVSRKPDETPLLILLEALYQFWWMDRVPVHAVVDAAVEAARTECGERVAGFVNAVLRKASQRKLDVPSGHRLGDLAVRYSHPGWLVQKWNEQMGFKPMALRLKADNAQPVHWVRLRGTPERREEALAALPLNREESRFERYYAVDGPLRRLLRHPLFLEGRAAVQDPASYLLVRLLDLKPGDRVLDLCAAPGGKSSLILDEFEGVSVVAADNSFDRLAKARELPQAAEGRLPLVVADGLRPPFRRGAFSHVLLDAPCSNLGVARRRPEALWKASPASLKKTAELQLRLLESASELLDEGGVLVYGTCSPEPEETYDVVDAFLSAHPGWTLEGPRDWIPHRYVHHRCLSISPAPGSLDGFFGARLTRGASGAR